MSQKSEISPSLVLILPKDLEVGNCELPRLKNTEIGKLKWIELIQQHYPNVYEVISRREDFMQLYQIAVHRPNKPLDFEWLDSTVGNFFKKHEDQPPPYKKFAVALAKMPLLEVTAEKIKESIKMYYENVLSNAPAPSVQMKMTRESHSSLPVRSPRSVPPPPLRHRIPSEPPQPEPLPKIRRYHDSFSMTSSIASAMEEDVEEDMEASKLEEK